MLFTGADGSELGDAVWSPDGTRIAFTHWREIDSGAVTTMADLQIWTMRPDGGDLRLAFEQGIGAHALSDPAWSPDGTQLTFALRTGTYVVGIDGSGLTRVGPPGTESDLFATGAARLSTPAWRPVESP